MHAQVSSDADDERTAGGRNNAVVPESADDRLIDLDAHAEVTVGVGRRQALSGPGQGSMGD